MKIDKIQGPFPFKHLIYKPSRRSLEELVELMDLGDYRLTVTSSMDHPVGVLHALSVALELKNHYGGRVSDSGCGTLHCYESNEFSDRVLQLGPFLKPMEVSKGIGFEKRLAALSWKKLEG